MILCIDPGLRGCGAAVFDHTAELQQANYVLNHKDTAGHRGAAVWGTMAEMVYEKYRAYYAFDKVLIETQIFRPTDETFKIAQILEVQGVAGAIAGLYTRQSARIVDYHPHEWKSTVDGAIMTSRISQRITPKEWENFKSHGRTGALDHNSLDAVGIGLHYFGRLEKQRVIAR